jgi:DNA-binding SARP family transcriptional activator
MPGAAQDGGIAAKGTKIARGGDVPGIRWRVAVVEFRVLGPVEVRDGDRLVDVPTAKARSLLVALLLRANRVVTVEELVDQVWDDSPPANPRGAVQTNIQRLRRALGREASELIRTRTPGYAIEVKPRQLDLLGFRELVDQARRADSLVSRYELLSEALALWRGPPLGGVSSESLTREEAPRLAEERLAAQEQLVDVELELGHHARVVPELTALTSKHPLRERPWAQLMLALYRCGRQGEALQAYRTITRHLVEELGIDPGEELRRLHQGILAADPSLAAPPAAPAPDRSPPARPHAGRARVAATAPGDRWIPQCQLPLDLGDFVGRADLVERVERLLADDSGTPIVTLSGSPGVGKTAVAVRVAHRLRPRFPDGQWYVRLGGATDPRDPADVLAELLRASGVERDGIPEGLDARAAALRARLADRSVLLVLDDAAGAEQVEPLLPGTAGCAVLATGRQELARLTASHAATGVTLDLLRPDEAEALLTRILGGARRLGEDAAGVAELAELCAYLPLALRIAAANLAGRHGATVAASVADLRGGDRLARLALRGDRTAAVRTAFDHSHAALRPEPRRLFGLLGLVPGPDFTAGAAAALLGDVHAERAEHLLETLANASLIQCHAAGRYHFHDLLRLYAAELAQADPGVLNAWRRLCRWYLATAAEAARFDYGGPLQLARPARARHRFADGDAAQAWLDAERANLVAAVARAADSGPHRLAWQLADTLGPYLQRQQHRRAWRATATAGLRAAEAAGDPLAEAAMHHSLGLLERQRDLDAAVGHQQAALAGYRRAGSGPGEALALVRLGINQYVAGRPLAAAELLEQALALIREHGIGELLAAALNGRSIAHLLQGELAEALRRNADALETDRPPQAVLLINRSAIRRLLGDYEAAAADVDAGLALSGQRRERQLEPYAHDELARVWLDAGRIERVAEHAELTLRLARQAGEAWCEAGALLALGDLHRLDAAIDPARARYAEALEVATGAGLHIHEAEARLGLAATDRDAGQPARALRQAGPVVDGARAAGLRILECQALHLLAAIHGDLGDRVDAERCAERARRIQDETGYRPPWHVTSPGPRQHRSSSHQRTR